MKTCERKAKRRASDILPSVTLFLINVLKAPNLICRPRLPRLLRLTRCSSVNDALFRIDGILRPTLA